MIPRALAKLAGELAADGQPFVRATVVRVERPTSVEPGNVALVRADGTIEGFVGGVCAQHSVRLYSLQTIESGQPVLLRILPEGPPARVGTEPEAVLEVCREEGAVTVHNPCLSGGSIEVFLEPFLPAPRVIIAGESPIAGALARLGPELGLEIVVAASGSGPAPAPSAGDLALLVAAHGRDELSILRAGVEAGVPYVGLVASRTRGAAVLDELRADGVEKHVLERIETPAGLDIGARSPAEIALAILARVVEVRRRGGASTCALVDAPVEPLTAVDPICGMTLVVGADTPSLEHEGARVYFCCEGCRSTFQRQQSEMAG